MKKLTIIQFLIYFGSGLFTPAWYILLYQQGGDASQFGLFLGLLAIGASSGAYFSGLLSDKHPYGTLGYCALLSGVVMLAYLPSQPLWSLYVLQFIFGILGTSLITVEHVCISRVSGGSGKSIGTYNTIVHAAAAVAMILSGVLSHFLGIKLVVAISAIIVSLGGIAALLFETPLFMGVASKEPPK